MHLSVYLLKGVIITHDIKNIWKGHEWRRDDHDSSATQQTDNMQDNDQVTQVGGQIKVLFANSD